MRRESGFRSSAERRHRVARHLPAVLAFAALLAAASPAAADGKVEAKYDITLAGVSLGHAAVVIEVTADSYSASGSAQLTGVMRAVVSGHGTAAVRGNIVGGRIVPLSYSMWSESKKRTDEVRMAMAAGVVRETFANPIPGPAPDRVPLTDAHRVDVLDPMSAGFIVLEGTGDLINPAACDRMVPIFDGRYRYEIELKFFRIEKVSVPKGYVGPAVVCNATYRPIAGHRPSKLPTKYTTENDEIRVWLVPIAGTRALVPYKLSIGTIVGALVLQATAFHTEAKEITTPVSAPKSQ